MSRSVVEALRGAFARVLGVASEHRRGLGAITLGVVAGAFLLAAQPWSAQSYELGDSGAWLNNGETTGRLNTQIGEIDFVGDEQLAGRVFQDGRIPYVVTGNEVRVLDPRDPTAEAESVALSAAPAEDEVVAGGGVVVGKDGKQVTLVARGGVAAGSPLMEVGEGSVVAVSVDGTVVAVDPERGAVSLLGTQDDEPRREDLTKVDGAIQVAMVGEVPVVLDVEGRRLLRVGEDPVDLGSAGSVVLQRSGPAADVVRVAVEGALLEVPLDGGDVRRRTVEGQALVRPAVDPDGCALGAWLDGGSTAVRAFCGNDRSVQLDGVTATTGWSMRGSSSRPVLNDTATGSAYYLDGDRIRAVTEPWPEDDAAPSETENYVDRPPNPDGTNKPTAVDDPEMGARLGRTSHLDVMWNDFDLDGDALLIDKVIVADRALVRVVEGGRRLAVTLPADFNQPSLTFEYVIHDGKQLSDPAKVTVTVRGETENEPPRLKDNYRDGVAFNAQTGQQIDADVLSYFWDPDGDPMYLASVTSPPAGGHAVDWQPSGRIRLTAGAPGVADMTATVNDDQPPATRGSGSLGVRVTVADDPGLAPLINNDVAQVVAGGTVQIEPLANDVDPGGDDLVLSGELKVLAGQPAQATPAGEVVSVTVPDSGVDYVQVLYGVEQVNDPAKTRHLGLILVKVINPNDVVPEAMPDVVTVSLGRRSVVDLLANDTDPRGALLGVTRLEPLAGPVPGLVTALGSDLRTFGVDALTSADPGTAATFEYEVTSGLTGTARSTVTVIVEPAQPNRLPRPIVSPPIDVRAGDVATVPFGRFVEDPDGDRMVVSLTNPELEPHIRPDAESVRVFAPTEWAGRTVVVDLVVSDAAGESQAASFTLNVTSAGSNAAPVAQDLEARVREGESVVIPIRATDPDGDSVRLIGRTACAACFRLGGEVRVDAARQAFVYTATDDAGAGGSFTYAVVDSAGQQSNDATVRILVVKREPGNQPPVPVVDRVVARANSTVFVDPTANDVDADGDLLVLDRASVESLSGSCTIGAPGEGDGPTLVRVDAGEPGPCTIAYRVVDALAATPEVANGPSVEGVIIVSVLSDFAGVPPIARDDYPERGDEDSVVVEVLANDEDPDGAPGGLRVSVVDGPAGVRESDGRLTIELGDEAKVVRYRITDPQELSADAIVRVPGRKENRRPQLVAGAKVSSVKADAAEPLEIDLRKLITDPDGDDLEFADVAAPTADQTLLQSRLGDGIVLFKPASADFSGVATLQVRATDSGTPPMGDVFSLTIEITPRDNRPPEWLGVFSFTVEKGGTRELNALPYADDPDPGTQLSFSGGGKSSGVEVSVTREGVVSVTADESAKIDDTVRVTLKVTDGSKEVSQEWSIKVTPSGELLPVASSGTYRVRQGESIPIDTADLVTRAQGAVTVIDVEEGEASEQVPFDGSIITYTAPADFSGDVVLRYTVKDRLDEDTEPRRASSLVTIQVIGRPGAPTITKATAGNGTVTIAFSYGPFNGGAPKPFKVLSVSPPSSSVTAECDASPCVLDKGDGLVNGTTYRFVVIANNEVGSSNESSPSDEVTPDAPPTKPTIVKAEAKKSVDGKLEGDVEITWAAVTGEFTAVTHYLVKVKGGAEFRVDANQTTRPVTGPHGVELCVTVSAVNNLQQPSPSSDEGCATPYGNPFAEDVLLERASESEKVLLSFTAVPNGRQMADWELSGDCSASGKFEAVSPVQKELIQRASIRCNKAGRVKATLTIRGDGGVSPPIEVSADAFTTPVLGPDLGVTASLKAVSLQLPQYDDAKFGGEPTWSYRLDGLPDNGASLDPRNPVVREVTPWTSPVVEVRVCNALNSCSAWISGRLPEGAYVYDVPPAPTLELSPKSIDGVPTGEYNATIGWKAPTLADGRPAPGDYVVTLLGSQKNGQRQETFGSTTVSKSVQPQPVLGFDPGQAGQFRVKLCERLDANACTESSWQDLPQGTP